MNTALIDHLQHINALAAFRGQQCLIADAGLADLSILLNGLKGGITVRLVQPGDDPVAMINAALSTSGLATLHLLAHGTPGQMLFQGRSVDADNFGHGLPVGAAQGVEVYLYGCHSGAGEAGAEFLDAIARLTGAAVHAASHAVGAVSDLDATWELDVHRGEASWALPFSQQALAAYRHVLAPSTTFLAATVNGTTLRMIYDQALVANTLQAGDFVVTVNGTPVNITGAVVNGSFVDLTLGYSVLPGQTVTVAYTDETSNIDPDDIASTGGGPAASLPTTNVANNTTDNTPPAFQSASVNGTTLTLTYNEVLDAGFVPGAADFTVKVNGATATVDSVAVDGNTVQLTLSSAVEPGQTVTVAYADTGDGTDNGTRDVFGNEVDPLTTTNVGNTTTDTTAPVLQSAIVDGNTLTLTYDELLDPNNLPETTDFTINASGGATTVSGVALSANGLQVVLTLSRSIATTETVSISYTGDGSDIQDLAGNDAGNLTTQAVGVICFLEGTRIATPSGDQVVEGLRIGDTVLTATGRTATVKWLGRQTVSARFGAEQVLPIRITAGALGADLPVRDLRVSPDHALLVDGVLVHASALVNGRTIYQECAMPERFTYYHIETEAHEIILAEGAPAETFIDNVARQRFDNYSEYNTLYPDAKPMLELDLPRVKYARQLPNVIRRRLDAQADSQLGQFVKAA